jgi:molybdopterin-guanine dinucleotide biosynthesis protein A
VDGVVPTTADGIEPLCAVYRRSLIPLARAALAAGERSVRSLYDRCRIRFLELGPGEQLVNLNTPAEYSAYQSLPRKPS